MWRIAAPRAARLVPKNKACPRGVSTDRSEASRPRRAERRCPREHRGRGCARSLACPLRAGLSGRGVPPCQSAGALSFARAGALGAAALLWSCFLNEPHVHLACSYENKHLSPILVLHIPCGGGGKEAAKNHVCHPTFPDHKW